MPEDPDPHLPRPCTFPVVCCRSANMPAADVLHGDTSQIVARPIEPKSRAAAPSLTPEQRKKVAQERKARHDAVEERITTWMNNTDAEAEALAATYGKDKQYYINLMFSGGPKLGEGRKSNTYNAWLHHVAQSGGTSRPIQSAGTRHLHVVSHTPKRAPPWSNSARRTSSTTSSRPRKRKLYASVSTKTRSPSRTACGSRGRVAQRTSQTRVRRSRIW